MRETVVSDKGWIKSRIRFASRFVPHIEVRVFSFEQRDEAKEWVRG